MPWDESAHSGVPKDLIAASSAPLILSLLQEEESYGYAIIKRVQQVSREHLQWTDGMLYPVLHRLERHGLVTSYWHAADTGRRRRYYRITDRGVAELERQKAAWRGVNRTLQRLWGQDASEE